MTRLAMHTLERMRREKFLLPQEMDPRALAQLKEAKLIRVRIVSGVRVYEAK